MKVVVLALGIALVVTVTASASRGRAAGTLQVADAKLTGPYVGVACPTGAPDDSLCWTIGSAGAIPGLGVVTESGLLQVDAPHTTCEVWHSTPTVTVAGKGTIALSVRTPDGACVNGTANGVVHAMQDWIITGGTGPYAGASGSGTVITAGVGLPGGATDQIAGTIAAPATTFDLTPPVIGGASAKTVRVGKRTRRVRVRFTISAQDDVDGPVQASCKPASGSFFRIGRTPVTCTATDSSANTATRGFTIPVKR
jgi:hypothetical protein